jgi:Na+-driven multidrug efflux pump
MILACVVFDPLLIICADLGVRGPGIAMILAQFFPTAGLLFAFSRGKFAVRLNFGDFLRRPIDDSWHAIVLGLPSLASSISNSVPIIFFQKYLQQMSDDSDSLMYLQLYNSFARLYAVALALYLAICMGLLACGSFAFSAKNIARLTKLVFHAWWILGAMGVTLALLIDTLPRQIALLFIGSDDPGREAFQTAFERCCRQYWSTTALMSWIYLGPAILQVVNRPGLALVSSFFSLICLFPIISTILFYTGKGPEHLFWSGFVNDTSGCLITLAVIVPALREMYTRRHETGGVPVSIIQTLPDSAPLLPESPPDEALPSVLHHPMT